jgi:PAS domain S-box-containing protein
VKPTSERLSLDALASGWAKGLGGDRKQFDMFFDKMLDGFSYHKIVVDKAGKPVDYVFLEVNRAFEQMTGLKRERIIGKRVTEVLPGIEKDSADWIGIYGKVALTGEGVQFENYSGPLCKWYKVVAYCPEKGHFVALFEDITERKKAEQALKVSEEKAIDLIKYAPTGIYELDYRGPKFKSVNDAMCQILGYTREELLSMGPFALMDDESRARFRDRVAKLLDGKKVDETVEYKIITKDGKEIYAVLNVMFTYKDGKPDGALVVAHDVTERRKMLTKLEEYAKNLEGLVVERTKQLRDAERLAAIGATAGMVGHDIRNPLQAITSDVYLARTDLATIPEGEDKESIKESLEGIASNVDYINKIVQDLQDFAKPINPVVEEVDFGGLCKEILSNNGVPKNIKSSWKAELGTKKMMSDPDLLKRILSNLVTNAVQAMPQGGKLDICSLKEAGDTVIIVQDTGVGIPQEVRAKLFTPLFTTKSKGQGFGLAVVKRMTEALGGSISFESEIGKGTKFIIRFPQRDKR